MTDDFASSLYEDHPDMKNRLQAVFASTDYMSSLIQDYFGYKIVELLTEFDANLKLCESPIEQAFYKALWPVGNGQGKPVCYSQYELTRAKADPSFVNPSLFVYPQHKIKGAEKEYRVDFLILTRAGCDISRYPLFKIIVECDGHDFHERTKEQAKKDKSRDRDLQSMGYYVFRFTGSEIHADAIKCATEVAILCDRVGRVKKA
jgi:very-short-patch-repair endonuclease